MLSHSGREFNSLLGDQKSVIRKSVWVQVPSLVPAVVDAATLKVKLPCNSKRIGVPTIIGRGVRTQRIV